jgi:hypothetical protein
MLAEEGADRLRFACDRGHRPLVELALVLAEQVADDLSVPARLLGLLGPVASSTSRRSAACCLAAASACSARRCLVLAEQSAKTRRLLVGAAYECTEAAAWGSAVVAFAAREPMRSARRKDGGTMPWATCAWSACRNSGSITGMARPFISTYPHGRNGDMSSAGSTGPAGARGGGDGLWAAAAPANDSAA